MPGICGGIIRKFSNSKNEDFCIEHDDLDLMSELSEQDMDSSEGENCEEFEGETDDYDDDEEEERTKVPKEEKVSRRKRLKERLTERRTNELRTVFVGNAPSTSSRRDIQKMFRTFGTIEAVYQRTLLQMTEKLTKLMQGKDKTLKDRLKSTNFFVRFKSQEEAENAARNMNGTQLGGNTLRVTTSNRQKFGHLFSIFLGNLPYTATDNQVRAHFAHCGSIVAVRVLHNRNSGMGTGVAYVWFEQRESCAKALEMNGQLFGGRSLRVSKVMKKKLLVKDNVGRFSSNNSKKMRIKPIKKAYKGTEERFVELKRKKQPANIRVKKRKTMHEKGKKIEAKGRGKRKSLMS